jgi:hypothetical protein
LQVHQHQQATGSRKAPNDEVWFSLRASQPSSQSVSANTTNITVATRLLIDRSGQISNTPTISGIATMRVQVSSVGMVKNMRGFCHARAVPSPRAGRA